MSLQNKASTLLGSCRCGGGGGLPPRVLSEVSVLINRGLDGNIKEHSYS